MSPKQVSTNIDYNNVLGLVCLAVDWDLQVDGLVTKSTFKRMSYTCHMFYFIIISHYGLMLGKQHGSKDSFSILQYVNMWKAWSVIND